MSNDLMIPDKASVPSYILNPELARAANEDAAAGISTGFPARIKLSGKQFSLVNGNGEETAYPPAKLVPGPDGNTYLPVIILRAKKALQKTWYAKKYNPNSDDFVAPDCSSSDGERPDASSPAPQSETCASCPHNAFGSGTDQDGNPSKGKACSDTKILAVFVPSFGVHSFKLPPASLKGFGLYVKQLSASGIPLGTVKTFVGFDLVSTYPVLVFKFGGFIADNLLPKLAELSMSLEVDEIVQTKPTAKALPAPAPAPAAPPPAAKKEPEIAMDLGLDLGVPAQKPAPTAPKTRKPPAAKPAPVKAAPPQDDRGFDIEMDAAPSTEVSDDDLAAELGL